MLVIFLEYSIFQNRSPRPAFFCLAASLKAFSPTHNLFLVIYKTIYIIVFGYSELEGCSFLFIILRIF